MKKALMYASVASMIQQFNMSNIALLQELGYKVDVACNFEFGSTISQEKIESLKEMLKRINVDYYHIPIPRKITDIYNLKLSYSQTIELINENQYQIIHCHSPIGGIICRLANKNSNNYEHTRMIYTAHGFHFFKGNNPLKNFLFRNIERYGAKYTNTLITINKEDYEAAKKFKLRKNGTVEYVPGVGIDIDKINAIQGNKEELCKELNIPSDSILLLSVGELNDNKNHRVAIQVLPELPNSVHYVICGTGSLKSQHEQLANELKVSERLHLLGYRSDVIKIMKSCDVFVFPSKREGLSVALMEAMASSLPCIASNIRGNFDLLFNDPISQLFDFKKGNLVKVTTDLLKQINWDKQIKNEDTLKLISQDNIKRIMIDIYKEKSPDNKEFFVQKY